MKVDKQEIHEALVTAYDCIHTYGRDYMHGEPIKIILSRLQRSIDSLGVSNKIKYEEAG